MELFFFGLFIKISTYMQQISTEIFFYLKMFLM